MSEERKQLFQEFVDWWMRDFRLPREEVRGAINNALAEERQGYGLTIIRRGSDPLRITPKERWKANQHFRRLGRRCRRMFDEYQINQTRAALKPHGQP